MRKLLLCIIALASTACPQSSSTNPYVRPMCSTFVVNNCTPQIIGGVYVPTVTAASGGTVTVTGGISPDHVALFSGATSIKDGGASPTKNLSVISPNGGPVLYFAPNGEIKQANDVFWNDVTKVLVLTGGFPFWQLGDSANALNLFQMGWDSNTLYFKDQSTPPRAIVFRGGAGNHDILTLDSATGQVVVGSLPFTSLPVAGISNGAFIYCSDCKPTNPCSGAGSGAMAVAVFGVLVCGGTNQPVVAGGGSPSTVTCWKSDGVTLGNATVAEITAGTCH